MLEFNGCENSKQCSPVLESNNAIHLGFKLIKIDNLGLGTACLALGIKSAFWILDLGVLAVVFVMEHLVLTPALYK